MFKTALFFTLKSIKMKTCTTYKKIASHEAVKWEFDKCLLLYSGGLDTSIMLK